MRERVSVFSLSVCLCLSIVCMCQFMCVCMIVYQDIGLSVRLSTCLSLWLSQLFFSFFLLSVN